MNAREHSLILYLLDAIQSAPEKTPILLARTTRRVDETEDFKAVLYGIEQVMGDREKLLLHAAALRRSMR